VLTTARSLPLGVRFPTFLILDEFQRFVGPDLEPAIPEVRQLGIKLVLSHQSLSQLKRGDIDLTNLIFPMPEPHDFWSAGRRRRSARARTSFA